MHNIEKRVDELIPPLLVLLLLAIIAEFFFAEQTHPYALYFDMLDGIIVLVFLIDLAFKYQRVRYIPKFVRKYWLEILAIFPFFLAFRFVELFRISELLEGSQQVLHEGVVVEKEAAAITREAAKIGKITRTERMLRYVRIFGRTPRFLRAIPFFEKPTGKHHPNEGKNQ